MRILVTGGAGYIGSHTVRCCWPAGTTSGCTTAWSTGTGPPCPADRLIVGDLRDADVLDHALLIHRIEAVVHFAAFGYVGESVTDPAKYYQNNVVNSLTLFERMRRHGVNRIVFSSTCATYGTPDKVPIAEDTPQRPINPYGRTKLMVEQAMADYAAAYGWGCTALRYFNASGAAADGSIGEDHDPETHLIPLVIQAAIEEAAAHRDLRHRLSDARRHLHPRLHPRRGPGRGACAGPGANGARTEARLQPRHRPRVQRPRGDPARWRRSPDCTCRSRRVRVARAIRPELVAAPAKAMKELGWKPRYAELEESSRPRGTGTGRIRMGSRTEWLFP